MITVNGFEPTFSKFPNGELNVSLSDTLLTTLEDSHAIIKWHFNDNEELVKLALLISTLEEHTTSITIRGGYLPYSRMDRREPGKNNPYSLQAFINLLPVPSSSSTDIRYEYEDVHNLKVASKLFFAKADISSNFDYQLSGANVLFFAKSYLPAYNKALVVLPDKGSKERYMHFINDGKFPLMSQDADVAMGYKTRDFDTREITDFGITNLVDNRPLTSEYISLFDKVVIIDDVVSYGNTFINLLDYLGDLGATDIDLILGNAEDSLWRGDLLSNKNLRRVYTSSNLTNHTSDDKVVIY